MRVLVTGGAGFIGSHVVEELVERGHEVIVIDDFSTGREENLRRVRGEITLVRGSILDEEKVREALRGVEAVVHLAAKISVDESLRDPRSYRLVNVEGTRRLLEGAKGEVSLLVFMSSAAVYGSPTNLPVDESHPIRPLSPYGESKVEGEELVKAWAEDSGAAALIIRLFNAYGPRQEGNPYAGVIAKFAERIRRGLPPVIYGDGLQTRDFINVRDVANFVSLVVEDPPLNRGYRVYNLGSGRETRILDLARLMADLSGKDLEPVHRPARRGDIRRSVACIKRVESETSWKPRVKLSDGLKEILSFNGALRASL